MPETLCMNTQPSGQMRGGAPVVIPLSGRDLFEFFRVHYNRAGAQTPAFTAAQAWFALGDTSQRRRLAHDIVANAVATTNNTLSYYASLYGVERATNEVRQLIDNEATRLLLHPPPVSGSPAVQQLSLRPVVRGRLMPAGQADPATDVAPVSDVTPPATSPAPAPAGMSKTMVGLLAFVGGAAIGAFGMHLSMKARGATHGGPSAFPYAQ